MDVNNRQNSEYLYQAFISYSRMDKRLAERLYHDLTLQNINVFLDLEIIPPGASIEEQIKLATQQSRFTICLISKNSLASPWVSEELLVRAAIDNANNSQTLIPCYVDSDFLADHCFTELQEKIATGITNLDIERQKCGDHSTLHLDQKRQRMVQLRDNLSRVLHHLNEVNSLPLHDSCYLDTLRKLHQHITNLDTLVYEPKAINNVDISSRQREIQELFARSDLVNAVKRLMDYVKEFVETKINDAILISQKFNFVEKEFKGVEKYEQVSKIVYEALELLTIEPTSTKDA